MSGKSIQISVRIPEEDADFISQLRIQGATTPSDKLRAIIAEARKQQESRHDYSSCISQIEDLIAPLARQVRHLENNHHIHSELLTRLLDWLPDMLAYLLSAPLQQDGKREQLHKIEAGVSERLYRLIEAVFQLGISQYRQCYEPEIVRSHLDQLLEITQIIRAMRQSNSEAQP